MKFKNSLKQRILIKPFIYKRESLSVQSLKIIFLLMIQVLMLLFTKTYNSFILVIVSVASCSRLRSDEFPYLRLKNQLMVFQGICIL